MNKSNTKFVKTMITMGLSLALTACGSSTDSETPTPTPTPTPNSAPVISSTGVSTVEAGSAYSYTLASSDADGDTLTLSASTLPAWLSFDSATGVLSGTPAEADEGDHAITLTVSDGTDEITQAFSIAVTVPVPVNNAPAITSTGVSTVEAGSAYSYTLASSDADGDTLTLSASTLPAWLSFDSATGVLSGTPAEADEGDHAITLTVSDGTDEITQAFSIAVTVPVPVNNAPAITSTAITDAKVDEAYSYTLTATDADNDNLTMSTTIPAALSWLTFDAATGILSGTPASGDVAATEITLTVNDGSDDTMQTFTITVVDAMVEPTPALVVFETAENPLWPAWDCCGGSTPAIITDADPAYDQVTQFTINGDTVVGFNARDAADGVAFDTPAGTTLEFDLKVTAMPTGGDTNWMLKLEDSADGAVEVNLNTSDEGQAPVLDTWVHYTFNVGALGLTDTDLIMIFPAWGTGNGAEYSIDNVVFYTEEDVTPPPAPETEALVVYEDVANPLWPAWDCCGGTTPAIITDADADYGQVTQFMISGDTVVGFNARDAVDGVAVDTPAGSTLEFDLKVTVMPTGGDTDWMLKLEDSADGAVEVNLNTSDEGQAPVLDTWVHYTFNVGALGLTDTDLIMIFPAWGTGDGAEYSIDNVVFYTEEDVTPPPPASGFVTVGTPYDFEAAGLGSDFDWAVFENDDNPALEFVANPASSAVNDSAIVAKFTARQTGQAWAGTETTAANTPAFTMDATNSIVKIMVYKSVISDVALKFSVGAAAQAEIKVANTKINEWEELTFDFSSRIGMAETIGINSVIVFPDFNLDGRASDTVSYFDNITFGHNE